MTKKMVWYACLGLLCCGLGAMMVNAAVTKTKAVSHASLQELMVKDAVGPVNLDDELLIAKHGDPEALKRAMYAEQEAALATRTGNAEPMATPVAQSEAELAKQVYENWKRTGTKTEAEAILLERYFTPENRGANNPLDSQGGPDAYGYQWVDNQGGDSATYAWQELRNDAGATHLLGTAWSSIDDGTTLALIAMPSFTFYGVAYTGVRLASNGNIQFTTNNGSLGNVCLPSSTHGAAIHLFWDDLHLGRNGSANGDNKVHYKTEADYFIIEYDSIGWWSSGNPGAVSMQVLLYSNGKIKVQYKDMTGLTNSGTVGIQQSNTGTQLQYNCNNVGQPMTTPLAVWYHIPPGLLHNVRCAGVTSPAGAVAPGGVFTVAFDVNNPGQSSESSFPVRYSFDGGATVSETFAGPIAPGATMNYAFTATVTAPGVEGNYSLTVYTDLATDLDRGNDTCQTSVAVLTGDNCAAPIVIAGLPYTDSRNTLLYTDDTDEICPFNTPGSPDVAYEYTPAVDQVVTFDICDSEYDTKIYIYANGVPPAIACNDDACNDPLGNPFRSLLECIPLTAGVPYCIIVDGYGGDAGIYNLLVEECVPCVITPIGTPEVTEAQDSTNETADPNGGCNNDDCGGVNSWSTAVCNADYTGEVFYYVSSQACGGGGTFRDTDWWELTLADSDSVIITVESEVFNTDLVVFFTDNDCVTGPTILYSAQQVDECTPFTLVTECLPPGTYFIIVLPGFVNPVVGTSWTYNMSVDCYDCVIPPCQTDFFLTAPGSIGPVNTAGAGDHCDLRAGEDYTIELTIPTTGTWDILFCNPDPGIPWDAYGYLTTECCGGTLIAASDDNCQDNPVGFDNPGFFCLQLDAGVYYLDYEPFSAGTTGDMLLTVTECILPIGRCCYGPVNNPSCTDTTQARCTQLGGTWDEFSTCAGNPCPTCDVIPTGTPEGAENVDSSNAYTDPNGGCNNNEACGGVDSWGTIDCGETVTGIMFTYAGPGCAGGGQYRDTDWFNFTLADSDSVVLTAVTEAPTTSAFIYLFQYDCFTFIPIGTAFQVAPCQPFSFNAGCLGPGTYTAFIAPSVFVGIETPAQYNFTLECFPCGTPCDSVEDLTIIADQPAPPDTVNLRWSTYNPTGALDSFYVYCTTVKNNDGDPRGNDPEWVLIASVQADSATLTASKTVQDTTASATSGYANYVVIKSCQTPPPPPCLGDSCEANEIVATNGVAVNLNNTCATTSSPAWPCAAGGNDVWVSYTATNTSTVTVTTCAQGATFDTAIEVFTDCPNAGGVSLVCLDDFCGLQTEVTFAGTLGSTYKIRVGGFAGATGTTGLLISQP